MEKVKPVAIPSNVKVAGLEGGGVGMKCAINMQLPDGSLKTLVYSVRRIADACAKAKKEHPTWEITGVSRKQ